MKKENRLSISNSGQQVVQAPKKRSNGKKPRVKTGSDLRSGK